MRFTKLLGALVVPLALSIPFLSSAARAASAVGAIKAANLTTAGTQGRNMDVQIQWWRYNPKVDHKCVLSVMAFDTWIEGLQFRYRVIAQANPGFLPEQTKEANPAEWGHLDEIELRKWFEKDMLSTWKKAFHRANDRRWHLGQNPQAFFEYKEKAGHWVMYGDLSQYVDLIAKGRKWGPKGTYIKINVEATKLWEDWTLNRCSVRKDF